MRTNVYKEKILAVLANAHLLSIADVHHKVAKANFSTIFRNIEQLCADGLVRKVMISKDVMLYELIEKNHHHDHFVCTDCGTIETIHLPEKLITQGTVCEVLIRGICPNCDV